jgi:hypothetical protein
MKKIQKIKQEIIEQLNKAEYNGDLGDIGNEIGIIIGKYLSADKNPGYEFDDFIHGVKHGISLTNGTH